MSWWESWFGEEYLDLYPHRDLDAARREAAFALAHLPARPRAAARPVLRVGAAFRALRRGGRAAGRPRLLGAAAGSRPPARPRPRASCAGTCGPCPFPTAPSRAVVNFFTSFGYFLRESENVAVIAEIERVLRRGGAFLCDTFAPGLRRSRGSCPRSADVAARRSTRSGAPGTPRRGASRRRSRSAARARPRSSARACARTRAEELVGALLRRGPRGRGAWGGFDGAPVGPDSPRLIVLARASRASGRVIPFSKYPGPLAALPRLPRGACPEFFPDPPTLDAAAERGRRLLVRGRARARSGLGLPASRRRGGAHGRGSRRGPRRRRLGRAPGRALHRACLHAHEGARRDPHRAASCRGAAFRPCRSSGR